jgi:hypothetical protein
MNEEILNTRGDQAFYMGAENAKIESAEKSAETGGHRHFYTSGHVLDDREDASSLRSIPGTSERSLHPTHR